MVARRARRTQRPFHIGNEAQLPWLDAVVDDPQVADLHRITGGDEDGELGLEFAERGEETREALAVARDVMCVSPLDGLGSWTPQRVLLIEEIEALARWIGDHIIGPGSKLVLAAVERPGAHGAALGDQRSKLLVGKDIAPRRRSARGAGQRNDVLARIRIETAQAIEEFQVARSMRRIR